MNQRWRNLTLFLVGATMVDLTVRGDYTRFVRPVLGPYLLVAGVAFVVLALLAMAVDVRRRRRRRDHEHAHWLPLVLVVAMAMIALVRPPALTVDSVGMGNSSNGTDSGANEVYPPLPATTADLSILEIVGRARWAPQTLSGHLVRTRGAVADTDGSAGDLVNIVIFCCAADAITVRLHLRPAQSYPDGTWLEVIGTATPAPESRVADFTVQEAHPIPAPKNGYTY